MFPGVPSYVLKLRSLYLCNREKRQVEKVQEAKSALGKSDRQATMAIDYCLIANKYCALAEHNSGGEKKMREIAQKLLKKLDYDTDSVESVDCDGKTYSYRVENGIVCVCVTDEAFGKRSLGHLYAIRVL